MPDRDRDYGGTMLAKDVMTTSVVTVGPDTEVREIARLLIENRISAVPVIDDTGHIAGIVSEGDLLYRPESGTERRRSWWRGPFADSQEQALDFVKTHGFQAKDVMTREVYSVPESASLHTIATLLERHRIKRVPVTCDGKLIGIVARTDLLRRLVTRSEVMPATTDERMVTAALLRAIKLTGAGSFVNAAVQEGVARLSGMVASEIERKALHIAAESTLGVTQIVDELGIFPFKVRAAMWGD